MAFLIITVGITIKKTYFFPELDKAFVENWTLIYENWSFVIQNASDKFFAFLLVSCSLGSVVGGITAAMIVKRAKVAYAVFIGFLLTFISWIDIFFAEGHPLWYISLLNIVLFSFSWLGGKITSLLSKE